MLKNIVSFVFTIALIQSSYGQSSKIERLLDVFNNQPQKVMVAAHRGGHIQVSENSLASIDEAISAGAEIVELDVRKTRDGVLVIMHDKKIDRTTTGKGEVTGFTFAELQGFYLTHKGQPTL